MTRPIRWSGILLLPLALGCGRDAPAPRESMLPVNGTELYVERVGSGPPLVVVHGGPLLDHGYLQPGLTPLADQWELVFFDQRLNGRSAGTVDSASVRTDTLVADLEGVVASLEVERVHLLAHSWGGHLALRYALAHPERVESLILVSPMAASVELWQAEEAALAERITPEHQAEAVRLQQAPGLAAGEPEAIAALLRHSFRLQFHHPDQAAELELYVPADYLERSRQFGRLLPDLLDFDLHPALTGLQVPTLILFGEDEPGAGLGGEAMAAALPDARLERIPEAGHFVFMERPDLFQEGVRAFLGGG